MVSNRLTVKYESQEFADLLNEHIKGLNPPSARVFYSDLAEIVGRKLTTVQTDMSVYRRGNLLGQKEFLTPNSMGSLESKIGYLQDILWAINVQEDSRMIEIIREVTQVYVKYPPAHIQTHVKYANAGIEDDL